jgi:nucleoside-diphosphate-sugar epimerase
MALIISKDLLVVGGTGFIGQHVLESAIKKGMSVDSISLQNLGENSAAQINGVDYLSIDLLNSDGLNRILSKRSYRYVVNLSGYIDHSLNGDVNRVYQSHFLGVLNLINSLDQVCLKRFIQVGTSDEYGNQPAPQDELMREMPISPYALAKMSATQLIQMLNRTQNFPGTILRLFLAYGPRQSMNRFIPTVISNAIRNVEFSTSGGEQYRDFCYIDDFVESIFLAFENDLVDGEVINIGSGLPMTVKSVVELIIKKVGGGIPLWGKHPYRPGENMNLYADINKAKRILNWKPTRSLDFGLDETIKWYRGLGG